MEGYAYSYPDSGDSSPRSREIDFENPPSSWDIDHQPPPTSLKVKFMVSYGGKIQPRSHDNQLAYVGGETKILAVDRTVKFSTLLSKLINLIAEDNNNNNNSSNNSNNSNNNLCITSFKYQLPGEDLDALISVTNDDDLEHMMHEYDRLYRGSAKPARLRLFAFPTNQTGFGSGSSDKIDRDRFVDALNSVPVPVPVRVQVPDHQPPPVGINNNMDFLFGLEGKNPPVPVQVPVHPDRVMPDLNRLQISSEHHQMQQQQQNPVGNVVGEVYQKPPPTIPASVQIPASYWQPPQHQPPQPTVSLDHQQPPAQPQQHQQQQQHIPPPQSQPVYMIHHAPPPSSMYHAPVVRPPPPQGYYQVQRVTSDPVYGVPGPQKVVYSTEGMGGGVPFRPVAGENTVGGGGGYHVAYDNATGRQVYYPAQGGGVGLGGGGGTVPFSGDVSRTGQVQVQVQGHGLTGSEGKVVQKASPTSATL